MYELVDNHCENLDLISFNVKFEREIVYHSEYYVRYVKQA